MKFIILLTVIASLTLAHASGTNQDGEGDPIQPQSSAQSIKSILSQKKGPFDEQLFANLLTLNMTMPHLFYTDIMTLSQKIAQEFPDIVSLSQIGKTWLGQSITVLTLDAREYAKSKLKSQPPQALEGNKEGSSSSSGSLQALTERPQSEQQFTPLSTLDEQSFLQLSSKRTSLKNEGAFSVQKALKKSSIKKDEKAVQNLAQISGGEKYTGNNDQLLADEAPPVAKQQVIQMLLDSGQSTNQTAESAVNQTTQQIGANQADNGSSQQNQQPQSIVEIDNNSNQTTSAQNQRGEPESQGTPDQMLQINNTAVNQESAGLLNNDKKLPEDEEKLVQAVFGDQSNSMLITGNTHPRELLSAQAPLFVLLQLIHQGVIQNDQRYLQMLAGSKVFFIPVVNPDGAKFIEDSYQKTGKIANKRKNMNPANLKQCGDEEGGTDLNRNWGVDWQVQSEINHQIKCGEYWSGTGAFSEPETQAIRDFISANKQTLKFVINIHTSGQEFIWPFNGRQPNDINTRAPGYLEMFEEIQRKANFPARTQFGNSGQVIGEKMGGDADDYVLAQFGIPSVTAELGENDDFIADWQCKNSQTCFNILSLNAPWIEHIMTHLGEIGKYITIK